MQRLYIKEESTQLVDSESSGVARLKGYKKFSCGVGILPALDGQDAHPTRVCSCTNLV